MYADESVTEPLLQELEVLLDKLLAANVDPDWIVNTVDSKVYTIEDIHKQLASIPADFKVEPNGR